MKIKILTWNIAYGYGLGSEGGPTYRQHDPIAFEETLRKISFVIRNENPDIVFLQEVDFDSKRSHYLSQLDWIARQSGLNFRAPIISWKHPYVPYPGLNPRNQFGKIVSGGGILSKTPVHSLKKLLLPKPKENSGLYNHFYLSRYLQTVEVFFPTLARPITLMNLHLEAFSKENRNLHLSILNDQMIQQNVDIIAGDFNGPTFDIPTTLQKVDPPSATFPSLNPNEALDGFILRKDRVRLVSVKTLSTGAVSDHLPVMIEVDIQE